jgi:hypothetical protein
MSDEFSNNPQEEPEEEFFSEEETGVELPDAQSVITLRTSGGDTRYVPTTEPLPASQVIVSAGVSVLGAVQYWLNGSQIQPADMVPAGSTLTVVGSVKGG